MRVLYDTLTTTEALAAEAAVLGGAITKMEAEVLDAEAARALAESISLPPLAGERVVVAAYRSSLPRAFDILLGPTEGMGDGVHLFLACPGPFPATFAGRFERADVPRLDRASLFEEFAGFGTERTIEDLVAAHPHLPGEALRLLHDEFLQGVGTLGEFIAAVHEGAREPGLRMSLGFGQLHAGMLACELDLQLQGRSLVRCPLTRVPSERMLLASSYATSRRRINPSTYAALVLHALI